MKWSVREATPQDIPYLAENLRTADKKELLAASGSTPTQALEDAFTQQRLGIWVGVYEGNPEIIFGVSEGDIDYVGFPWMVCTDKLKESPREFVSQCKTWVNGFSRSYPLLLNFVHAENDLHIRWLKWCGFEFVKLHRHYGVAGEPFWEFRMERKQ